MNGGLKESEIEDFLQLQAQLKREQERYESEIHKLKEEIQNLQNINKDFPKKIKRVNTAIVLSIISAISSLIGVAITILLQN